MSRTTLRTLAWMTALVSATACTIDNVGGPNDAMQFDGAFDAALAGMDATSSSYAADSSRMPWGGPMRGRGPGGPGMAGLMGGGLGADFMGHGVGGRGAHRGPFAIRIDSTCTFSAATGDVTCGPTTRHGLTATTVFTIKDATGAAQSSIDTVTTNTVRTRSTVTGTVTRDRDGAVTATVNNSSDRTVTGLAAASTQRTVNGTSAGQESATGTNRDGQQFTAVRVSFDTTAGLVIPVSSTTATYPTAGKVVRRMKATTTIAGGTATVRERREEIVYDGTATAKLTITQDGTTKNCTMALPRGRPNCG